jgi:predicted nucleic acid-binding protein
MYLVDTNINSSGAPSRARPATDLIRWMDERSAELYLSSVTVAEIEAGIAKVRRCEAARKAADLTAWLEAVIHLYGDRILAFDVAAARAAGTLLDFASRKGFAPQLADIYIAATALCHHLTVLTRNTRHFEPLGITTANPFLGLPSSLH